ncbi:MAG: transglycosylase SLT domain-containing protein [Burkholderiales bacterium]
MLNRINGATQSFDQSPIQFAESNIFARLTAKSFITAVHRALLVLGIFAIAALGMMFFQPHLADRLKALSPFNQVAPESGKQETVATVTPQLTNLLNTAGQTPATAESANSAMLSDKQLKDLGTPRQQRWITNWLSKRYHVAGDAANMLVSASYLTARETKLDPLLILAVMSIESGLNPFAESAMGAQGLMQVMSKVHHEKFEELGGAQTALNPVANIKVGSLILKDYVTRGGSVEAGLKLYVGASAFDSDAGYGAKVLAEYHRLKEVATGKNVPTFSAPAQTNTPKLRPQAEVTESGPAPQIKSDSATPEPHAKPAPLDQLAALIE